MLARGQPVAVHHHHEVRRLRRLRPALALEAVEPRLQVGREQLGHRGRRRRHPTHGQVAVELLGVLDVGKPLDPVPLGRGLVATHHGQLDVARRVKGRHLHDEVGGERPPRPGAAEDAELPDLDERHDDRLVPEARVALLELLGRLQADGVEVVERPGVRVEGQAGSQWHLAGPQPDGEEVGVRRATLPPPRRVPGDVEELAGMGMSPRQLGTLAGDLVPDRVTQRLDVVQVSLARLADLTLGPAPLADHHHRPDGDRTDERQERGDRHDRAVALGDGNGQRARPAHDGHHHHAGAGQRRSALAARGRRGDRQRCGLGPRRLDPRRPLHQCRGHGLRLAVSSAWSKYAHPSPNPGSMHRDKLLWGSTQGSTVHPLDARRRSEGVAC